jgi:hypothetical protein
VVELAVHAPGRPARLLTLDPPLQTGLIRFRDGAEGPVMQDPLPHR